MERTKDISFIYNMTLFVLIIYDVFKHSTRKCLNSLQKLNMKMYYFARILKQLRGNLSYQ